MKLSDCLAKIIQEENIECVFGLQGGAVVHLFDSLENNGTEVLYLHHEQAVGLAAVSYAKVNNTLGCGIVTSGPASTNAITGLLAAWQDSVPCIFISGQARSDQLSYGKKVRQVGVQEVNIVDIVKPITKLAKCIYSTREFEATIIEAIQIAKSGRPGPVWIDIPVNLQWEDIKYKSIANEKKDNTINTNIKMDNKLFNQSVNWIIKSKKPLFILGYGLRLSNTQDNIINILNKACIPFVTSWNAADYSSTDNKYNMGIIGMFGQRGANKIVFDSDLIVCLGTHLSAAHTTNLTDNYAKKAKKIIVNIDKNQLDNLNIKFDLIINADLRSFINSLKNIEFKDNKFWDHFETYKNLNWSEPNKTNNINSFSFIRQLSSNVKEACCYIIDGGGTALYAGHQSTKLKEKDRIICSSAISAMGTGLAESLGVAKTKKYELLFCIIGDGSFIMNIQDLQSIVQEKINLKIIVINNNGYQAIRNTQNQFLEGRLYGTHPDWNLKMPTIEKMAVGFEVDFIKLKKPELISNDIKKILKHKGPLIVEVIIDENQKPLFRQKYIKNDNGTFSPRDLSDMLVNE
jgi:acetolactate synthase I/II/III large subunit